MNTLEKCKQSETYKDWIDTDNVIAEKAIDNSTVIVVTKDEGDIYTKTRLFLMGINWYASVDKIDVGLNTIMQDLLDNYSA